MQTKRQPIQLNTPSRHEDIDYMPLSWMKVHKLDDNECGGLVCALLSMVAYVLCDTHDQWDLSANS